MAELDFSALWQAFRGKDGRERDRVVVGVAAAFALIAVADGRVDATEVERFLDVVRGSRLAAADTRTRQELARSFDALVAALFARPEAGKAECLRVLSDFGFDPMRSEIIWSAASAALVADAQLPASERQAESEIRDALRIRPSVR